MNEIYGDALELIKTQQFNCLCITTNGTIKGNGECVMGRGIALTIKQRIPQFPLVLGNMITVHGNHVYRFPIKSCVLFSFPVKHNWYEEADPQLIVRSAKELVALLKPNEVVLLPRPGCGNGKLSWADVKPLLEPILTEQVFIVHWGKEVR